MAQPLTFKPRLRLPEGWNEPVRAPLRRRRGPPVAALSWVASVGLCWGLAAGRVPAASWLDAWLLAPAAPAALAPTATPHRAVAARRAPEPRPTPPHILAAGGPPPTVSALALASLDEPVEAEDDDGAHPLPEIEPAPTQAPEPAAARAAPTPQPASELDEDAPRAVPLPTLERAPTARPAPPETRATASSGQSCEAAAAAASQDVVIGGAKGPADFPLSAFSRVLDDGSWFSHCGASERITVDVCVAVRHGRAIGVTVTTRPSNSGVARCIASAARGLRFPASPRVDVARTRFAAK